eukprot:1156419-Pelagomonas_calceolata.AAC.2
MSCRAFVCAVSSIGTGPCLVSTEGSRFGPGHPSRDVWKCNATVTFVPGVLSTIQLAVTVLMGSDLQPGRLASRLAGQSDEINHYSGNKMICFPSLLLLEVILRT